MSNTKKVYDFLVDYIKEKQYAPSFRDISEGTGIKSTNTVYHHMHKLKEKGVISFEDSRPRTIRVLREFVEKQHSSNV